MTLWKHQQTALELAERNPQFALFMDMGTGKTLTTLALIKKLGYQRVLVTCPKSVIEVWCYEAEKHMPGDFEVLSLVEGSVLEKSIVLKRAHLQAVDKPLIVVVNYDSVWRGELGAVVRWITWDMVVLDESQRIKSAGAKVSRFFGYLGREVPRKLLLTGTPMPNSPLDVYGQFRFLDPTLFGTRYAEFQQEYAVLGGYSGREVLYYKNLDDLRAKVQSRSYRVKVDEVLTLPEGSDTFRYDDLETDARRIYRAMDKDLVVELKTGTVTAANLLVKLLRLHQFTGGSLTDDNGRLHEVSQAKRLLLEETLTDIGPHPVVVFARFHHDLNVIQEASRKLGWTYYELSGRDNNLKSWQRDTAPIQSVLGVQIASGGLGVDLTRAHYAIYYSLSFSLGEYDQSKARLRRPGQGSPVTYIHLLLRHTVDERIMRALVEKKDVVQSILEEGYAP